MNISRTGKYYYLKLLRLKGSPHALSLGASIGVFIGITPTIPLHTLVILLLALLTRSSFIAGLITSWIVCNPLTYVPIYYFSLKIGNAVTPFTLNWEKIRLVLDSLLSDASLPDKFQVLINLGYEAIIVMLIGGTLLALPFGIASYYIFYYAIVKYRRKKREKQVLK